MTTTSTPAMRFSRSAIRWGSSVRSRRESSAIEAGTSRASYFSRPTRRSIRAIPGGPLFNQRGEVIGVTSRGVAAFFADNLGFAIPVYYVKQFINHREAFAFDKVQPQQWLSLSRPAAPAESRASPWA